MKIASVLYEDDTFGQATTINSPDEVKGYDLMILHGGADISPSIYGEKVVRAHASNEPSLRDRLELACLKAANEAGVAVLGICRGLQLVTAAYGGKLIQHVDGHNGGVHNIWDLRTKTLIREMTTCHHQAVLPDSSAVIIATEPEIDAYTRTCYPGRSDAWIRKVSYGRRAFGPDGKEMENNAVNEVVFWKEQKTLGVQGHPEWHRPTDEAFKYILGLMRELLGLAV